MQCRRQGFDFVGFCELLHLCFFIKGICREVVACTITQSPLNPTWLTAGWETRGQRRRYSGEYAVLLANPQQS